MVICEKRNRGREGYERNVAFDGVCTEQVKSTYRREGAGGKGRKAKGKGGDSKIKK